MFAIPSRNRSRTLFGMGVQFGRRQRRGGLTRPWRQILPASRGCSEDVDVDIEHNRAGVVGGEQGQAFGVRRGCWRPLHSLSVVILPRLRIAADSAECWAVLVVQFPGVDLQWRAFGCPAGSLRCL